MSGEQVILPYRIAVCIASGDQVMTMWAHDYARLMNYTAVTRADIELMQVFATGSLVPKQRNTLLRAVIEDKHFTHAFFIDTDMRFPRDALVRLLSYGAPAVGINYTRRNAPFEPVAFVKPDEYLYTTEESTGLVQVQATGFGLFLIDLAAIKAMKEPYFTLGFNFDTRQYMGEDFYFCTKVHELGLPVMVDQDLSKECAHIGRIELTCETANRQKQIDEEKKSDG